MGAVTDPNQESEVVVFNFTSWSRHPDNTCLIKAGEHPFVTRDTVVAIKHGEELFERLKLKEKKFVRLEGIGHNDLFSNTNAWKAIESFLEE